MNKLLDIFNLDIEENLGLSGMTDESFCLSILKQLKVSKASLSTRDLNVIVKDEITLLLNKNTDVSSITPDIQISSDLVAPISENSVIGTITYNVDGNTYSSDLLAGANVLESNAFQTFLTIASIVLVLLLLYRLLQGNNKRKKRRKKKSYKNGKRANF